MFIRCIFVIIIYFIFFTNSVVYAQNSVAVKKDVFHVEDTENTVIIAMEDADNSPFSSYRNKEFNGFHYDLLNGAAQIGKFKIKWLALPWSRALKSLENGLIHGVTFLTPNEGREKYTIFNKNNFLHSEELCLFVNKDVHEKIKWDGNVNSLPKIKYGFNENYYVAKSIEDQKMNLDHIVVHGTSENLIQMLLAKRIDGFFSIPAGINAVELYIKNKYKIKVMKQYIMGDLRYIGFSKNHTLGESWSKRVGSALDQFRKTVQYKKILKKYNLQYLESLK